MFLLSRLQLPWQKGYFLRKRATSGKSETVLKQNYFTVLYHSYGKKGQSLSEVRDELVGLDNFLQKERPKFTWISSASPEYSASLAQIHFAAHVHSNVLDIHQRTRELAPHSEVEAWVQTLVLNKSESGLIQSLAALNQIIQGLNTLNGISIVGVFSEQVGPSEEGKPYCDQVHLFRDYLQGIQILGYSLLSAALNYLNDLESVQQLLDLALQRLKQQEEVLGGRYNDW